MNKRFKYGETVRLNCYYAGFDVGTEFKVVGYSSDAYMLTVQYGSSLKISGYSYRFDSVHNSDHIVDTSSLDYNQDDSLSIEDKTTIKKYLEEICAHSLKQ